MKNTDIASKLEIPRNLIQFLQDADDDDDGDDHWNVLNLIMEIVNLLMNTIHYYFVAETQK